MSWRVALLACCGVLGGLQALHAQSEVFRFVDAKGVFHFTDRLADVPEPYYSFYLARQREREAKQAQAGIPTPAVTPRPPQPAPEYREKATGPSIVEVEEQRRLMWKALVARWREELTSGMAELEAIRVEKEQAAQNPLLRLTPEVQAQIAAIETRETTALARLERARKALVEELPARAKRESVSPKWLE